MSLDTSRTLFGVVTSTNPLLVLPAGNTTPLDVPITSLESVGLGDRVMLAFQGKQLTLIGVVVPNGGAWVTPPLGASWSNYGSGRRVAGYRKVSDGEVTLRGLIKSGTLGSPVFTLPEGFRPGQTEGPFVVVAGPGTARIDVTDAGEVIVISYMTPGTNAYVSLSQVKFDSHV